MDAKSDIYDINGDVWMEIFFYCNVKDFLAIALTCNYIHSLTDNTKYNMINKFWQYHSKQLCLDIEILNFKTKDWKQFYVSLCKFFISEKYTHKRRTLGSHQSNQLMQTLLTNTFAKHNHNYTYNYQLDVAETDNGDIDYTINWYEYHSLDSKFPVIIGKHRDEYFGELSCGGWRYPIVQACVHDNVLIFQMLSKYFTNINDIADKGGITLLGVVITCRNHRIADHLLGNNNCDINIKNNNNYNYNCDVGKKLPLLNQTPLIAAAFKTDAKLVQLLLQHPNMTTGNVNKTDVDGRTPLHCVLHSRVIGRLAVYRHQIVDNRNDDDCFTVRAIKCMKLLLNDERTRTDIVDRASNTVLYDALHIMARSKKTKFSYTIPKELVLTLIESPKVNVYKKHLSFAKKRYLDKEIVDVILKRLNAR